MRYILLLFIFLVHFTYAQDNPSIKIIRPSATTVSSPKQFIVGITCKNCIVKVNESAVNVYSTGTFAYEAILDSGVTKFTVVSTNPKGKTDRKEVVFNYSKPAPPLPVSIAEIATIQTLPEGNLLLKPGDKIQFKVKALPGRKVTTFGNTVLYEQPTSQTNGMPGIYQGAYVIKAEDNFSAQRFDINMQTPDLLP